MRRAGFELIPQPLMEAILWRLCTAKDAASCSSVCRLWEEIIRESPVLELEFKLHVVHRLGIPRVGAIIAGLLQDRPKLRELSIVVEQSGYNPEVVSEDRIVPHLPLLASRLEKLRVLLQRFNLSHFLGLTQLREFLVCKCILGEVPQSLPIGGGGHLRFCSLDSVMFNVPLNMLLSVCRSLEGLILAHCRMGCGNATSLRSESLRRLFIYNTTFDWIALDVPELEIVGLKSFTPVVPQGVLISGSRRTRVAHLLVKCRRIRLRCRVDELDLVPASQPWIDTISAEAREEMLMWLDKFQQHERILESLTRMVGRFDWDPDLDEETVVEFA